MKVAIISPIPHLDLTKQGDIHMCLTHLVLKDKAYRRFYAKEDKYKLIDNGLFEGEPNPIEKVLEAAEMIGADEIVLPDILYDGKATVKAVKAAIKKVPTKYVLHAVVQGSTPSEWWQCLQELQDIPEVNVIGLSKLSCPKAFSTDIATARLRITMQMELNGMWHKDKQYHLLGGSNNLLYELFYQSGRIRSIDSGAPVEYGMKKQGLDCFPPLSAVRFAFGARLGAGTLLYIHHNIKQLVFAAHRTGEGSTK